MALDTLTSFFGWCTVINGVLFCFWAFIYILAPNFVFRTQSRWFSFSEDTFHIIYYCFLGACKILYLFLNVTPYLALRFLA